MMMRCFSGYGRMIMDDLVLQETKNGQGMSLATT